MSLILVKSKPLCSDSHIYKFVINLYINKLIHKATHNPWSSNITKLTWKPSMSVYKSWWFYPIGSYNLQLFKWCSLSQFWIINNFTYPVYHMLTITVFLIKDVYITILWKSLIYLPPGKKGINQLTQNMSFSKQKGSRQNQLKKGVPGNLAKTHHYLRRENKTN